MDLCQGLRGSELGNSADPAGQGGNHRCHAKGSAPVDPGIDSRRRRPGVQQRPNLRGRLKADEWYTCPDIKEGLVALLARYGLDEKAITAQAFALRSRELEKLEHMLASAELRRSSMLREIGSYRDGLSWRLRSGIEIVDEEFSLAPPSGE